MRKIKTPSAAEGLLLFEIDPELIDECLIALGGVPLLVQAIRSLDVAGAVKRHVRVKQRERGFDEATYVESFGGCCKAGFRLSPVTQPPGDQERCQPSTLPPARDPRGSRPKRLTPFFPQPGAVRILEQRVFQPAIAKEPRSVVHPIVAPRRRKGPLKIGARMVDLMHQPVELRSDGRPGRPILIQ